jgi:hypothetical protein
MCNDVTANRASAGQTGEADGRARVTFVRNLVVGSSADAYDENMKVWRSVVVEGINPERTIFTVSQRLRSILSKFSDRSF